MDKEKIKALVAEAWERTNVFIIDSDDRRFIARLVTALEALSAENEKLTAERDEWKAKAESKIDKEDIDRFFSRKEES